MELESSLVVRWGRGLARGDLTPTPLTGIIPTVEGAVDVVIVVVMEGLWFRTPILFTLTGLTEAVVVAVVVTAAEVVVVVVVVFASPAPRWPTNTPFSRGVGSCVVTFASSSSRLVC